MVPLFLMHMSYVPPQSDLNKVARLFGVLPASNPPALMPARGSPDCVLPKTRSQVSHRSDLAAVDSDDLATHMRCIIMHVDLLMTPGQLESHVAIAGPI